MIIETFWQIIYFLNKKWFWKAFNYKKIAIKHFLKIKQQQQHDIREIKIHVYRKRQTSDSSWEFLRIENKQIKTVPNDSYG